MTTEARCRHCHAPLDPTSAVGLTGTAREASFAAAGFCCAGCEAAFDLLTELALDRYYDLRGEEGIALAGDEAPLDPVVEAAARRLEASSEPAERLTFDVSGLHCAACVWVIERMFEQQPSGRVIVVHPGAGILDLEVEPRFHLRAFAKRLRTLGYRLGRRTATSGGGSAGTTGPDDGAHGLLLRVGLCAAGTMNVMALSLPSYLGQTEQDGSVHRLMIRSSAVLAGVVVWIGGEPFFRSALQALRARALHLDVPIALGIVLAYAGSLASLFLTHGASSYFDTVAAFTTLMVLGRFLQERVLVANRRVLLADPGVEDLPTLVVDEATGAVTAERVGDLAVGSALLWRPGDLLPVDAEAPAGGCSVRRDFLTGEARVVALAGAQPIEAGSILAGETSVIVKTTGRSADSRLAALLRTTPSLAEDAARRGRAWALLSRGYVFVTLGLAAVTGVAHFFLEADAAQRGPRALAAVVAVLVVACPCAFGIAVPVAYEGTLATLRRHGIFVRSAGLLDRLPLVKHLVFDKTGTLTNGEIRLVDGGAALLGQPFALRQAVWNLAVRSSHPKARAVAAALGSFGFSLVEADVREMAGQGLEGTFDGSCVRLGSWAFATDRAIEPTGPGSIDLAVSVDGRLRLTLPTEEQRSASTKRALAELGETHVLHLLSGDHQDRVYAFAQAVGLEPRHVVGAASPEQKRAYVAHLDNAMMIGDGINDAAAMSVALASATPAGDRPFVASRADCYVSGSLTDGLVETFTAARRLQSVVREAVGFGVAYNVLAVCAAMAGRVTPLGAAILMPSSSLLIVGWVVLRLARPGLFAPRRPRAADPIACPVVPSFRGGEPAEALVSRGVV
jgi:P-type Cu2+ transporter